MLKRLIVLVVVLALGLSLAGAQDSTVFCGDLSTDDCNLLVQSADLMSKLASRAVRSQISDTLDSHSLCVFRYILHHPHLERQIQRLLLGFEQ